MTTIEQVHDDVDPLDVEIEFDPGWIPEPGDKFWGKWVERGERDAGFGLYPIHVFELSPGHTANTKDYTARAGERIAVHASHDVLRRKLANARLEPGTEVGIKFEGPPEGSARSYRYRVVRLNPDGTHVEIGYDDQDAGGDGPTDADAATQLALETERERRDEAASEGVVA